MSRGCVGIMIGFVDIVAMVGRWSLVLMCPCLRWMLSVARLFVSTMSGVVADCVVIRVGKCGPMWCSVPSWMNLARCLPTGLV